MFISSPAQALLVRIKLPGRPGEAEIAALRAAGSAPLLLGFGVSRPEHVRAALEAGANGAIAGSAVAQVITENLSNVPVMLERLTAFVKDMKPPPLLGEAQSGSLRQTSAPS